MYALLRPPDGVSFVDASACYKVLGGTSDWCRSGERHPSRTTMLEKMKEIWGSGWKAKAIVIIGGLTLLGGILGPGEAPRETKSSATTPGETDLAHNPIEKSDLTEIRESIDPKTGDVKKASYLKGKDIKHGLSEVFFKSGKIKQRGNFVDNKRDGTFMLYYEDGTLSASIEYRGDVQEGIYKSYREDGTLEEEAVFKNGQRHGPAKYFHGNEKLDQKVTFKEGKMEGVATQYYDTGEKKAEITMKNDLQHGPATTYYRNGKVKSKENFTNNKLNGEVSSFDENGIPLETKIFRDGTLREIKVDRSLSSGASGFFVEGEPLNALLNMKMKNGGSLGRTIKSKKGRIRQNSYKGGVLFGIEFISPFSNELDVGPVFWYKQGTAEKSVRVMRGEASKSEFFWVNGAAKGYLNLLKDGDRMRSSEGFDVKDAVDKIESNWAKTHRL